MKRSSFVCLFFVVALAHCSDIAGTISGSCNGTQTIAGMTVNMCTESPALTVSNQATLNTACRSGQLGSIASSWSMGNACQTTVRVGGCRRVVQGIDVISWVYPTTAAVNATVVRAFCAQIQATYVAP